MDRKAEWTEIHEITSLAARIAPASDLPSPDGPALLPIQRRATPELWTFSHSSRLPIQKMSAILTIPSKYLGYIHLIRKKWEVRLNELILAVFSLGCPRLDA